MAQTTMKIDVDVLKDLQVISRRQHRSPQKQIAYWVSAFKQQSDKARREEIARLVEASEALEGFKPLAEASPETKAIEQRWIDGEISITDYIDELKRMAHG